MFQIVQRHLHVAAVEGRGPVLLIVATTGQCARPDRARFLIEASWIVKGGHAIIWHSCEVRAIDDGDKRIATVSGNK